MSDLIAELQEEIDRLKAMYASLHNEKYYWKSETVDLKAENAALKARLKRLGQPKRFVEDQQLHKGTEFVLLMEIAEMREYANSEVNDD
jgi:hypothetical protein